MALTDAQCRNTKPTNKVQKLSDGGGLHLQITPAGSRLWRCSYRWDHKQRTASFGSYPAVGLARARLLRAELKDKLAAGIDPAAKEGADQNALPRKTFEDAAREWFRSQEARWVSGYAARIWTRLKDDAFPSIGHMDVAEVAPTDVLNLLRKIEDRGAIEMAKRVRQSISAVFRFSIANGWCVNDPSAPLASALKARPRVQHRKALSENELPAFLRALDTYCGERSTALGLKLIAHTFVRTSEARFAKWSEFDGDLWRIPAERMKVKSHEHLVPLSPQVRAILAELKDLAGDSDWILPGQRGDKPISEVTLIYGVYRAGFYKRATVHGLRGTASTILNESGLFRSDAIERQLAHVPADEVRSAYNAALYLAERREMMNWYSDRLDDLGRTGDLSDLLF